jgi:hypothetical protein
LAFKWSNAPDYEAKKNRALELDDIADHKAEPAEGASMASASAPIR